MKAIASIIASSIIIISCNTNKNDYDASGTFEAVETIISAEASGVIKELELEEGQVLNKDQTIGYIDSVQLYLKRKQLQAQVQAILSKKPNISAQVASLFEQLKHAEKEQLRVANLLKADAATQKQYDDATAQVAIVKGQIEGLQSSLGTTSSSIIEETMPLHAQIEQLEDQLAKCKIVNAVNGTVLTKYVETHETATQGKPLYKIADLSNVILRAYITGDQLPQTKLNQTTKVLVDDVEGKYREYPGTIEWISNKAEFTPKTIQTKDERANLVYAVKIKVKNDGFLKVGMYGEVKF